METTIIMGYIGTIGYIYWGNIGVILGIMEKKMETTIILG